MIIIIFLLTLLPTGFTQNTQNTVRYFTYQETSVQPNLTGLQPQILNIRHYKDNSGTVVVRIARTNYYNHGSSNYCYEQRLLLRVIKADGSVIQINYENATEIPDINYCDLGSSAKKPLNFYPLFGQYILVTYTHATNTSDTSTYVDCGMVFDWGGNIIRPYQLQSYCIATLNGGYALIYTNTTNRTSTSDNILAAQFSEDAGIYAIMLSYNQSKTPQSFILYKLAIPNITFTSLYCSIDFVFIGHSCIVNIQTTTTTNSSTFYVKIRFLSSGTILSLDSIFPPNNGNLTIVRTLPFGGYAIITGLDHGQNTNFTFNLYDEDDKLSGYNPLKRNISNFNGTVDVLQNNTILVALNETTTSWKILLADLTPPSQYNKSDYGNMHVREAYPPTNFKYLPLNNNMINITFDVPVSLSDAKLTIYQKINKRVLRQFINSTNCNNCITLGKVITLNVLSCTFNDPGGHYFIQMDNNFVKSAIYNESMLGIDKNVWSFQTNNITSSKKNTDNSGDIRGILRLTISGSRYFQELNDSGKHEFFVTLIDQLILMIPTEKGRLESDELYQLNTSNILISLFIHEAKDNEKLTAANIKDYLHQLITHKTFTVISMNNATNFLDDTYGFQQSPDIGKNYSALIIIVIMTFIILLLLSFILSFKLKSKMFETIISAALKVGLIIPNFILLILFVAHNSNNIPELHLPSVLILSIPLLINFCIAIYAIYKGIKVPVIGEFFKKWIIEYRGLVTMLTVLVAIDYEFLTILKDLPIFTKKLYRNERINTLNIFSIIDHIFEDVIIWGAFIDIFFRNIPQIIILAVSKFIILPL
ncbi:hypothetical protein F8M41_001351 [Gigaspora margarita]|uniref:Uncharacterized protein n=1 Tax=Gigaspora margarita TaxID=4874 RepID=A0A8H3XH33_GIGMA|nr:hypothetical protein F8M41_001351 [Gigaspora margarita]